MKSNEAQPDTIRKPHAAAILKASTGPELPEAETSGQ